MRYFKKNFLVSMMGIFAIGMLNISTAIADDGKDNNIDFRWAFGAIVGPENDQRLVAITRDTTLKTGDQVKMLVELKKRCFIYVIHQASDKEISLLFPYGFSQFETDYRLGYKYYIPSDDLWFELDENVGLESIYLIASSSKLNTLEELLIEYEGAKIGFRDKLGEEILAEIRKLKRKHRKFRAKAERPITIGGTVRGVKKDKKSVPFDIDPIADNVSAKDFYGRTFTIDHQ